MCAKPLLTDIHLLIVGDIDHRTDTLVVVHQCDVDRKFVIALDKFDGTIQRIDQPEELPILTLFVQHLATLFAQNRDARHAEYLLDLVVGQAVGYRYGCAVALDADVVVVTILVDLHNLGTGLDGCIYSHLDKVGANLVSYNHLVCLKFHCSSFVKITIIFEFSISAAINFCKKEINSLHIR